MGLLVDRLLKQTERIVEIAPFENQLQLILEHLGRRKGELIEEPAKHIRRLRAVELLNELTVPHHPDAR